MANIILKLKKQKKRKNRSRASNGWDHTQEAPESMHQSYHNLLTVYTIVC